MSGSSVWIAIGKPKLSEGRCPRGAPSCRRDRPSGRRRSGSAARGAPASRVDEQLVDALADLGELVLLKSAAVPLFSGSQVSPPSSLRKTPAAEIATYIVWSFSGSIWIECVHMPPAPGFHCSRVGCSIRLRTGSQVAPLSSIATGRRAPRPARTFRPGRARRATPSRPSARCLRATQGLRCAPMSCRDRSSAGRWRRRPSCSRPRRSSSCRIAWKMSQPASSGSSTSHLRRSSSPWRTKSPLRVPTRIARTIGDSLRHTRGQAQ